MKRITVGEYHHDIIRLVNQRHTISAISRALGINRKTVYLAIEKQKQIDALDASGAKAY
ncbi:hypothetical protein CF111_10615 [Aeromonas sobria]|jgi:DNA invertase Pin-like site-specific DNA recombinase|uniref:helix-turn-helix domain-containing protein n=1 Tax=Aeromonas sobria TaxID=646 RepID=UPI00111ABC6A|nr:helix-turn-helix domain-containing protein [Aeromonas sobria]TNJ22749.1 hypothetical protein CF111_10615 [Aeromonas sobria]